MTTQVLSAAVRVERHGDRLYLRCGSHPDVDAFINTLPNCRWSRKELCWQCDATPAAAWRLQNELTRLAAIEPDAGTLELVTGFASAELQWRQAFETGEQPELRTADDWKHQVGAYWYGRHHEAALFAMGMGTGKTKPTVELVVNTGCRRSLVLCPSAVLGVWRREFAKWAAKPVEILVLDRPSWSTARQAEEAAKFLLLCEARNVPAVVVQNYESACYKRGRRMPFGDWSLSVPWDIVICDESHRIAKPKTNVSLYAAKLTKVAKRRLCLTGTPLSHSPLDIFGQARFLDPGFFGTSWHQFRNRYAVSGPFGADHIVAYKDQDELARRMALFTYEVGEEVLDLPPVVHQDIVIPLSSKVQRVYRDLETEMIAAVGDGYITAANGLVKLLRLQQLTSGYLPEESGGVVDLGREKQEALAQILDDMNPAEPVVVFTRFTEDLRRIRELAERTGRNYGEISGRQRDLTPEATMPEGIELMGVQISSGGVGIDLTRACQVFFYSIGFSLTDYEQALRRSHRPGQTRTTHFRHLVCEGTVDEAIYKALQKRRNLVEAVLEYLRAIS